LHAVHLQLIEPLRDKAAHYRLIVGVGRSMPEIRTGLTGFSSSDCRAPRKTWDVCCPMESRIRPVFTIYFNRQIYDDYQLRTSIYTCSSSGECWNAVNAASSEMSSHLSELKPHTTNILHPSPRCPWCCTERLFE